MAFLQGQSRSGSSQGHFFEKRYREVRSDRNGPNPRCHSTLDFALVIVNGAAGTLISFSVVVVAF